MLERDIERKVCDYAHAKGVLAYKFTSPSRAAVPDRMFVFNGRIWFCEFKQLGKKPTPQQEREHKRLRDQGVIVFVVDNVESGQIMVDMMIEGVTDERACGL